MEQTFAEITETLRRYPNIWCGFSGDRFTAYVFIDNFIIRKSIISFRALRGQAKTATEIWPCISNIEMTTKEINHSFKHVERLKINMFLISSLESILTDMLMYSNIILSTQIIQVPPNCFKLLSFLAYFILYSNYIDKPKRHVHLGLQICSSGHQNTGIYLIFQWKHML